MLLKNVSFLKLKSPDQLGLLSNEATPFSEIGIGKPLLIRLHTIYLGELKKGIFGGKKDVIVCSQIKDDTTYGAAPRGVHQIFNKKDDRQTLYPSSSNEGTALIYYSKAFDKDLLRISVELKSDRFREKIFDSISNALSLSSGIPIFGGFSNYLIAGGQIIKSASNVLNSALEGTPFLKYDDKIVDGIGGLTDTQPGFKLAYNNNQENEFKGYSVAETNSGSNKLVLKKGNKEYKGDAPYMILSFDGNEVPSYEGFTSTLASAAILKKFYGVNENTSIEEMKKMVEVYNDFNYVEKIEKAQKELESANPERKTELNELIKAYKKNITNDDLFKIDS